MCRAFACFAGALLSKRYTKTLVSMNTLSFMDFVSGPALPRARARRLRRAFQQRGNSAGPMTALADPGLEKLAKHGIHGGAGMRGPDPGAAQEVVIESD